MTPSQDNLMQKKRGGSRDGTDYIIRNSLLNTTLEEGAKEPHIIGNHKNLLVRVRFKV